MHIFYHGGYAGQLYWHNTEVNDIRYNGSYNIYMAGTEG